MKQPSVPWQRSLAHSTYPFCKKNNLVTRVLWVKYLKKHLLSPTLCVLLSAKYYCKQPPYCTHRFWWGLVLKRKYSRGFPRLPFKTADFSKVVVGRGKHRWHGALPTRGPRPRTTSETNNLHTGDKGSEIYSPPPIYFLTLTPMFPEFHNKPLRWYLFPDPLIS